VLYGVADNEQCRGNFTRTQSSDVMLQERNRLDEQPNMADGIESLRSLHA
jgi:hypothetical protein